MKPWLFLVAAIALEVTGTTLMKLSSGMTKWFPTVGMYLAYGTCMACLAVALKDLPIGSVYAIWSGVGTALIVGIGSMWFRESITLHKLFWIGLIIVGVVGLKLSSGDRLE